LEVAKMTKNILGLNTCAKALSASVDRIRYLIHLRKIKPKRDGRGSWAPYIFTPRDQEIIRQHTSMRK